MTRAATKACIFTGYASVLKAMLKPELALYEPDIPFNSAACMRLVACLGTRLHIIEPCGFVLDDRRLRKAGMDYRDGVVLTRHASWQAFQENPPGRLVLATTKAAQSP